MIVAGVGGMLVGALGARRTHPHPRRRRRGLRRVTCAIYSFVFGLSSVLKFGSQGAATPMPFGSSAALSASSA